MVDPIIVASFEVLFFEEEELRRKHESTSTRGDGGNTNDA